MKAGFGTADLTPPAGTVKAGWLKVVVGRTVRDPLSARACVLESGTARAGFVALDVLAVRHAFVAAVRKGVENQLGFPGDALMVCATHNHAGPTLVRAGDVRRDDAFTDLAVRRAVEAVGAALAARRDADVGFGRAIEASTPRNRRVVLRDGTVRTHGSLADPQALAVEGPVDPEVAVVGVRSKDGKPLGCLVNFALHPTEHGGDEVFTAGWPGAMTRELARAGWPNALLLQGAAGDVHPQDPAGGEPKSADLIGTTVAAAARRALEGAAWERDLPLRVASRTLRLPYRNATPEEIAGTVRGAQRFIDPGIYDREIPRLLEKMRRNGTQPAEVAAVRLGHHVFSFAPAELFCALGLAVKERAHPRIAHVVGYANGMVGYVPTQEAFARGGYETTFMATSKLAPEAGNLIVDGLIRLAGEA